MESITPQNSNYEQFSHMTEMMQSPNFLNSLHKFNKHYEHSPLPSEVPVADFQNLRKLEDEYTKFYGFDRNLAKKYNKLSLMSDKDDFKRDFKHKKQLYKELMPEYREDFKELAKEVKKKLNKWIPEYTNLFEYITVKKDKPSIIKNMKALDKDKSELNKRIKILFIFKLMKRNDYINLILKKFLREEKLKPYDISDKYNKELKQYFYDKLDKLFRKKIKHISKLYK